MWAERARGRLEGMTEMGASIPEGIGEDDVWRLQLRFDDHDLLSEFFRRCVEKDVPLDLETVYNPGVHRSPTNDTKLKDAQRETLEAALTEGYFDVPRRITVVELAESMDISDSAVSQRLRRGVATVLDDTPLRTRKVEDCE